MIRNKFKKLRIEAGYTQKQLADILSVEPQTISKYENSDKTYPDTGIVKQYAEVFHVTTDYLLDYSSAELEDVILKDTLSADEVALLELYRTTKYKMSDELNEDLIKLLFKLHHSNIV